MAANTPRACGGHRAKPGQSLPLESRTHQAGEDFPQRYGPRRLRPPFAFLGS
jgi:hypothetical protein